MSSEQAARPGQSARLRRLNDAILWAFILVALALIYWSVARSPVLMQREDNPRLVEAALRIQRGRILDRNDLILAQTVGEPDQLRRLYPLPEAGPAVGYYSFRHGTAGVERAFDTVLRGQEEAFWENIRRETLHRPQVGRDIRLTLDANWQELATGLMGQENGAVLLLTIPDGGIRVMVSRPGYDPNRLDETFEVLVADEAAPLLNRVTQGQYQPGLTLQPFVLAAAVDQGLIRLDEIVAEPDGRVLIGQAVIRCAGPISSPASYADGLRQVCPAPLLQLADQFGAGGIAQTWQDFGLTRAPSLAIRTETTTEEPINDPSLAVLGQENLTITPLQLAVAWAALANNGRLPDPVLVTAVMSEDGNWQTVDESEATTELIAVGAQAARAVFDALPRQEQMVEHSVLVLSGPDGSSNGWYLGLAPAAAPRYAVVVVVEESSAAVARQIGRELLAAILASP